MTAAHALVHQEYVNVASSATHEAPDRWSWQAYRRAEAYESIRRFE